MTNESTSQKETIAVFGAGGFIGSHMVVALIRAGYRVQAIDLTLEKLEDDWDELNTSDRLEAIDIDIRNHRDRVEEIVRGADIIIDLIAFANPSIYVEDPLGTVDLNLFENLRIVELCHKYDKFLIQYSTCEVYGLAQDREDKVFSEDTSNLILGPINQHRWIYACAKQMLERIVHAYGMMHDLNYIIIRPFNFVGPRIDYLIHSRADGNPRVFSHFMSALLLDKPLPLVDGGKNLRSYVHIADATQAFLIALENRDKLNRQIVNIGTPNNETSIRELAHLVIRLYEEETGKTFTQGTVDIPGEEFYGPGYADIDRRIPDASKMAALGWAPTYDLEATFRESIRYYLEHNTLKAGD